MLLGGILAPAVYVPTVVVGGILRPDYSHISDAVSELTATGAPNKVLLEPLFALYNLLLVGFGIGFLLLVRRNTAKHRSSIGSIGAMSLVSTGIVGWVVFFFPQDPGGPPVTYTGTVHVALGGVLALASMLAILMTGLWFRSIPRLQALGTHSFASLSVVLLAGILSAASVASEALFIEYIGVVERISIGGFLQWLFMAASVMRRSEADSLSANGRGATAAVTLRSPGSRGDASAGAV